jgi:hypothetical protein
VSVLDLSTQGFVTSDDSILIKLHIIAVWSRMYIYIPDYLRISVWSVLYATGCVSYELSWLKIVLKPYGIVVPCHTIFCHT